MSAALRPLPPSGRLADDPARFQAVFVRHYPMVLRALRRVTASRAEAEDLAQDTFVSLGWHRFDDGREHNLRAWLLRTAINRALNARRGRARRQGREASVGLQLVSAAAPDPEEARERARVRQVLCRLEPRACQLLVLRAVGLSYAELAEVIGVAPGSIGTLLVRAQRTFAEAFAGGTGGGSAKEGST